jgi:3-oxoacyl-[acyl-carrier protein] reductase
MKHLDGKVAVVTGSGQGIGKGIALFLAQEGAAVVTNNRKPFNLEAARQSVAGLSEAEQQKILAMKGDAQMTAEEINLSGGKAVPCFADVCKADDVKRLIATAISHFGRIDILVNNAAGLGQGTVQNTTEAQWDRMTQAKMKGAFLTMHEAVPYMIEQGGGTILNSASDAWVGIANLCAYSAGNAGIVGLTKSAAEELKAFGITVNAYCPQADSPGHEVEFTKTVATLKQAIGEDFDEAKLKAVQKQHKDPMDLAPFLAYLCTEDCKTVTGNVFGVTAGGHIELYNDPKVIDRIEKDDAPWTIDELSQTLPKTLFQTLRRQAPHNSWNGGGKQAEPVPVFDKGEAMPEAKFHGKAYLNLMVGFDHPSRCSVGQVTFGPGAHNDWHTHFGWQVLLVTDGEGYYQEEGQPAKRLKKGDVVVIKPGVKHWHGAAPDRWFVHLGLILNETHPTAGGDVISKAAYQKLIAGAQN